MATTEAEATPVAFRCCERAPHLWTHPSPQPEHAITHRFVGRGRAASRKHMKSKAPVLFRDRARGSFRLTPHEKRIREAQAARKLARGKAATS